MRLVFAALFLCLVVASQVTDGSSSRAAAPKPTPTSTMTKAQRQKLEQIHDSAPADEYFGKMKLSYLGINNTFRDQAIRAGDHTVDQSVANAVHWAEDALNVWRAKYTHDPQLARSLYLAFLADRKIWLPDYQQRATGYLIQLRRLFPTTYFGKQARVDLAKGMTMNFYGQAQPCDSSLPTNPPLPMPTADARNHIKVNVIPAPCFTAAPAPSTSPTASPSSKGRAPSLTPSPSPSASTSPVKSPSPTPHPSPSPSLSPSPAPSPSLSPSPAATPSVTPAASPSAARS